MTTPESRATLERLRERPEVQTETSSTVEKPGLKIATNSPRKNELKTPDDDSAFTTKEPKDPVAAKPKNPVASRGQQRLTAGLRSSIESYLTREQPENARKSLQAYKKAYPDLFTAELTREFDERIAASERAAAEREERAKKELATITQLLSADKIDEARSQLTALTRANPAMRKLSACQTVERALALAEETVAGEQLKNAIKLNEGGQSKEALEQLRSLYAKYPATKAARDARQSERTIQLALLETAADQTLKPVERLLLQGNVAEARKQLATSLKRNRQIASTQTVRTLINKLTTAEEKKAGEELQQILKQDIPGKSQVTIARLQAIYRKYPRTKAGREAGQRGNEILLARDEKMLQEKLKPIEQAIASGNVEQARARYNNLLRSSRRIGTTKAANSARRHEQEIAAAQRENQAAESLKATQLLVRAGKTQEARQRLIALLRTNRGLASTKAWQSLSRELVAMENKLTQDKLQEALKLAKSGETARAFEKLRTLTQKFPSTTAASQAKREITTLQVKAAQKQEADAETALKSVERSLASGEVVEARRQLDALVRARPQLKSSKAMRSLLSRLSVAKTKQQRAILAKQKLVEAEKAYKSQQIDKAITLFKAIVKAYPTSEEAAKSRRYLESLSGTSKKSKAQRVVPPRQ